MKFSRRFGAGKKAQLNIRMTVWVLCGLCRPDTQQHPRARERVQKPFSCVHERFADESGTFGLRLKVPLFYHEGSRSPHVQPHQQSR
ncbi:MAG: hypothetical protein II965_01790, partial [Pyramidobacter sp.]|nr:hypothetical protein [Pyramidobacter sp.]